MLSTRKKLKISFPHLDGVEDTNSSRKAEGDDEDNDVGDTEGVPVTSLEAVLSLLHRAWVFTF